MIKNGERAIEATPRSQNSFDQIITDYIREHDAIFNLPILGAVTVSGRSLSDEETDLEIGMDDSEIVEGTSSKQH